MLRRFFAYLFFAWLIALLVLTYYPDMPELKIRLRNEWFRLDYIGHFGFYAVLTALFLLWRAGWKGRISRSLLAWSIAGGLVLAVANEFAQLAIPGRSFNPADMMYNCAGIITAVLMVLILRVKG